MLRFALAALGLLVFGGCEENKSEAGPSAAEAMRQDPASELATVREMLSVLDERGLGFDEALKDVPAQSQPDSAKERAVLELQTTLQTEIELLRRKLTKADPAAPNLALLGQVRTALDRHELATLIRSTARSNDPAPNDRALLLAELETQVRETLKRRVAKLTPQ